MHEEEEGEIAHWSEEEWGEKWEQWDFGGEDDMEEDQEYEEEEEDVVRVLNKSRVGVANK